LTGRPKNTDKPAIAAFLASVEILTILLSSNFFQWKYSFLNYDKY